jgi:hypothetical protein
VKHKRPIRYILSGHTPVPVTPLEWLVWFSAADRHVAFTVIAPGHIVSTMFLGDGVAMFETAILTDTTIPGERCNIAARYHTWADAERGHDEVVRACSEQYRIAIRS